MRKVDCKDCVCLVDGVKGDWVCDERSKPIDKVNNCPEGLSGLAIGDEVKWEDPDNGISTGIYEIKEFINEDVLLLSNGTNEVEAFYYEIS